MFVKNVYKFYQSYNFYYALTDTRHNYVHIFPIYTEE